MNWTAALAGLGLMIGAAAPLAATAADLPDLAGREIVDRPEEGRESADL